MTIRDIEIFSAVCEQMNMSKAAQQLFISQSSVSQAIAELEREYQVKLFERLSKKLFLTEAGEAFLFYAKQMLHTLEQMDIKMRDVSSKRWIRIGACTTVGSCFINPLLDRYQELCPEVKVTVEIGNSSWLEQRLRTSDLDLAFVQDISRPGDMISEAVLEDELVFICNPSHALAGRTVCADQLAEEAFVVREEGSGTRRRVDAFLKEQQITPRYSWICNSAESMKQAVAHDRGIAMVSVNLIQEELKQGKLAQIKLAGPAVRRKFYLILHKNKYRTDDIETFLSLCQERFWGKAVDFENLQM